ASLASCFRYTTLFRSCCVRSGSMMHGWRVASPEVRVFVGDARVSGIPLDDRGLAYGDGVFETMRAHRGELPWWDSHWARLERGRSEEHTSELQSREKL